jgi:uncharacterized protein (DUF4415 family)
MSFKHPPLPPDDAPFDDEDNPEWTDEMFARARPPEEFFTPEQLAAFPRTRTRGRPVKARPKIRVAVRLDPDVVDHFRATGPGWQTRINDALAGLVRK